MGVIKEIDFVKYPKQSRQINKKVQICYHFDFSKSKTHNGVIIRDDMEEPFVTIIKTKDRYLLATECQYQIID